MSNVVELVPVAPQLADPELEQALIASLIAQAGAIDRIGDLTPEDFADPLAGAIYAAVLDLRADRLPINTLNLRAKAGLSPMGREAIMAQIAKLSFAGEPLNVADLSRQIVDFSLRRQLQELHRRYQIAAGDGSQTVKAHLSALRLEMDTLVSRMVAQGKTRLTHKQAIDAMLKTLQPGQPDLRVPCGIGRLDSALSGGVRRGEYTVLAGRPGAGKSTMALAMALGMAKRGHGVLYHSPEMSTEQLALRAASAAASTRRDRIPYAQVIARQMDRHQEEHFTRTALGLPDLPILYDDSAALMASEIHARTRQAKLDMQEKGKQLDVLIVDHMGKVRPTARYKGNKVNEVGEVSEAMATIAREENIAVLALHQLNRQVESRENKRPNLADLRDSGNVEQDADVVLFAYREAYYLEQKPEGDEAKEREMARQARLEIVRNNLEILIAKNRRGETGVIHLFCDVGCNVVQDL
jgi:replicative DNA helicase